jgi:superfamily II DNA or RNA helicase
VCSASKEMDINEKWLGEIGGWAAMKAARTILSAGGVEAATQDGDTVRGRVGGGKNKFAAGLRIRGRTDIDNLCACPTARRGGAICEHSIAVALAIINPNQVPKPEQRSIGAPIAARPLPLAPCPTGTFSIFLPEELFSGALSKSAQVFLKFESGGQETEIALHRWLSGEGLKCGSMPLILSAEKLSGFFSALAGHPRVYCGRPSPIGKPQTAKGISVSEMALRIPAKLREKPDQSIDLEISKSDLMFLMLGENGRCWWFSQSSQLVFPSVEVQSSMIQTFIRSVKGEHLSGLDIKWVVNNLVQLEQICDLSFEGEYLQKLKVIPAPCQFELEIEGDARSVTAKINAKLFDSRWGVGENKRESHGGRMFPIQHQIERSIYYTQNIKAENEAAALLLSTGFKSISNSEFALEGKENILKFYGSGLSALSETFEIKEGDRWKAATRNWLRIAPRTELKDSFGNQGQPGRDWLTLDIAYESTTGFRIPRAEVLQMIRAGRRGMQDRAGRQFVIDVAACEELESTLQDVNVRLGVEGGQVRAEYSDAFLKGEAEAEMLESELVRHQLGDSGALLRDYQMTGVRWLERLGRIGRAGLLADDMGLGKTFQIISTLRLLGGRGSGRGPALVVCPKSLIANWQSEFLRFAPEMVVVPIVGEGRKKSFSMIEDADVILTTYQLIVRDLDVYLNVSLRSIVLDEASYIRNADTEASKAIRKLKAPCRFALTGTPIENSIRDLWSIFQFLLPGYLGTKEVFKERFEQSLSHDPASDEARSAGKRLKRLVKPYFLRRTKAEVLPELPEKIEQVIWCDLSPVQNDLYRRVLDEGLAEIRLARKRSGDQGGRMTMFTVLLRLRQICCDLRLSGFPEKTISQLSEEELSGKLSVFMDRIEEISRGGGKVLVFSQFVQFLRILRSEIEGRKYKFSYLDGSTQDRGKVVDAFESDPECRVFLISLKAGGYGLNLTSANHVILMDPWWNPAVEAQAIDRAHRMGQNRSVTALRLVTRGTVEEKILKLQAQKRGVIEATLDEAGSLGTGLTDAELMSLVESP